MCPYMKAADAVHELVAASTMEELPELIEALTWSLGVALRLLATTTTPVEKADKTHVVSDDVLLTVVQAAEQLGVRPSWLYRHWRDIPGGMKLGHRTLRFNRGALSRWMRSRPTAPR